ncbi:hypothetical protein BHQ19_10415 [Mycolicibacterium porcinum]|nr:hypothetical protein BHQ19_10415 [Mycolicibacterium porcinum]
MDYSLQHTVEVWRTKLRDTDAADPADPAVVEIRQSSVNVLVDFSCELAALQDVGLHTGYDTGGRVQGRIAFADLDELDAVPGVERIRLVPDSTPALDTTVGEVRTPWKLSPGTFPGRGKGVIVAVIDTGIDIFHESFRKNDASRETRILELWDQDSTVTGGHAPPPGFSNVGTVFSETDINNALKIGGLQFSRDTDGHGTHVAGIAAGNGQQGDRCSGPGTFVGVAPDADLVVVRTIGVKTANIRDAFHWCAKAGNRNKLNGKPRPVVINCSFGKSWGPHDGKGLNDIFVKEILRPPEGPPPGLAVVASAGNQGEGTIHTLGTVPANGVQTVPLYMPKGSVDSDIIDIWYNGDAALAVEVIAPPSTIAGTRTTQEFGPAGGSTSKDIGKMSVTLTTSDPQTDHDNMRHILISIRVPSIGPKFSIRPGEWQVKLRETAGVAANWNAWTQFDSEDPYPTFSPDDDIAPEARRANTIGTPGSALDAITVAAYDNDGGKLAQFSSRGADNQTTFAVGEMKPTVAAPGISVTSARGTDNPDKNMICCNQKVIDLQGTSQAAPHVTGLVALMFERNPTLTFVDVRKILQQKASIDGIPDTEKPTVVEAATGIKFNHLWGSGKVDGLAAIQAVPVPAGGAPVGPIFLAANAFGYTPFDLPSRIGYVQKRFGNRPSLMLFAALMSEHIDEILGLVNGNRKVLVVWRRGGGPSLVRHLLNGPMPDDILVPGSIRECNVAELIPRFITVLHEFGGTRLRSDLERFREFLLAWPGSDLAQLDRTALAYGATS